MSSSVSTSAATTVKTRKRKHWGMASAICRTARTVIGALKCNNDKFICPNLCRNLDYTNTENVHVATHDFIVRLYLYLHFLYLILR